MMNLLLIGFGGFAGAISRYAVSGLIYRIFKNPILPYGTLVVNISGCLIIGFLIGLSESRQILSPEIRSLLMIGFLGAFTTFSTFGYETISCLRDGQLFLAGMNILLHFILGMGAVWFGLIISRIV